MDSAEGHTSNDPSPPIPPNLRHHNQPGLAIVAPPEPRPRPRCMFSTDLTKDTQIDSDD